MSKIERREETTRIPGGILKMLQVPRSMTLVKGAPGTGKTAFALEAASALGNAILVTRGRDFEVIKERFPQVERGGLAVLDVTTWLGGDGITNTTLLERVRVLGLQLNGLGANLSTRVVIIDEIGSFLTGLPRNDLPGLYLSFVDALSALTPNPFVIISSDEHTTGLEARADAFLALHDTLIDGREMRILEIIKLPGGRRLSKRIPFTLFNNKFTLGIELARVDIEHAGKWVVCPDPVGSYSTGSESIDMIYPDSFKLSSFNLMEIDPDLPLAASNFFLSSIINFLMQHRAVFMAPVTGINTLLLGKNDFTLFVDAELLDNNFRVVEERAGIITDCRPYVVQIENRERELFRIFMEIYDTFTNKNKYSPLFSIIEYTSLDYRNDAMLRQILNHAKFCKNANVIEFAIVNGGIDPEFKAQLASIATTHTRLQVIENGVTIFTSLRPRSPHFFVELDSPVIPKIRIVPVV